MEDKEDLKEEEKIEEKEEEKEEKVEEEKKSVKKEGKKNNTWVVVLLSVCIVALIVAIVWVLLLPKDKKEQNSSISNDSKEYYSNYKIKGNSLDNFDLYFMKLENEEKNKIYSPLSIKYALEMLAEGASGDSKKQIDAVIGDYVAKKYTNSEHMSFANAMFIRDSFKDNVKEEYTSLLKNKYYAEVVTDPFQSAGNINKWISDKTLNLIKNPLTDEDVTIANFYLLNALAIDMNWNYKIQCQASDSKVPHLNYWVDFQHEKYHHSISCISDSYKRLAFNNGDYVNVLEVGATFNRYDIIKELGEDHIRQVVGDAYREWLATDDGKRASSVAPEEYSPNPDTYLDKYMKELGSNYKSEEVSSDFSLYVDDDVKLFAKDLQTYDGITLQYVGIMPQREALKDFVENADAKKISGYISNLKELKLQNFKEGVVTKVIGDIPIFQFDYSLNLKEDLINLGIKDVFDSNKADLSAMLKEHKGQFIFKADHKATIDFSNLGIKAAAVTIGGGAGGTVGAFDYLFDVPVETIDVTFDKPYMFLIRDKKSGEIWFTGTVYNPTKKQA